MNTDFREASLSELFDLRLSLASKKKESQYLEIIYLYLKRDIHSLRSILMAVEDQFIKALGMLRYTLATNEISEDLLQKVIILSEREEDLSWKGEASFLIAMAYGEISEYQKSKEYYQQAYNQLWKSGLKRKAVKSLLNFVVSESYLKSENRVLVEYEYVAKKAREIEDHGIEAICILNLASEYRRMGAYPAALKQSIRALELGENEMGTQHYYLAILEKAHNLIEMNRIEEAQYDLTQAEASGIESIVESVKVLRKRLGEKVTVKTETLDANWKIRLQNLYEQISSKKLTKKEAQLIELIVAGEKTRDDLIDSLYGTQIDYESAGNRFRVLMSRFRKKIPNLLIYEDGIYRVSDQTMFEKEWKDASQ